MCKDIYDQHASARHCLHEIEEALQLRLRRMMFEGDEGALSSTAITQPALLAHSAAIVAVLSELSGGAFPPPVSNASRPPLCVASVAGHSVGEYPALVAAGALSVCDAARLLRARGLAMQAAADKHTAATGEATAMKALLLNLPYSGPNGLHTEPLTADSAPYSALFPELASDPYLSGTLSLVSEACAAAARATHSVVCVAGVNSPSQIVLSGGKEGVEAAISALKDLAVNGEKVGSTAAVDPATSNPLPALVRRVVSLPVSAPFHSSIMTPAALEMGQRLGLSQDLLIGLGLLPSDGSNEKDERDKADVLPTVQLKSPRYPLICNATATPLQQPSSIATALVAGITRPVLWHPSVHVALALGRGQVLAPSSGNGSVVDRKNQSDSNVDDSHEEAIKPMPLTEPGWARSSPPSADAHPDHTPPPPDVTFLEIGCGATLTGLVKQCLPASLFDASSKDGGSSAGPRGLAAAGGSVRVVPSGGRTAPPSGTGGKVAARSISTADDVAAWMRELEAVLR